MNQSRLFRILTAAICILALGATAAAAEIDCDSIYCFSQDDFANEPQGICITALPDSRTGTVLLGTRVIRTGDILTLEQASQMTFSPLLSQADQSAKIQYLPIFADRVEEDAVMTITIRGKDLETTALTVPASKAVRWSLIFIAVIPGVLLAAGVAVILYRKRR